MTIKQSLAQWMQNNGFGTRNVDLFLNTIPKEKNIVSGWWIVGGGGAPEFSNQTGEKGKPYIFAVFFRDRDSQNVDETLQSLEETVNSKDCKELEEYETYHMEATGFQSDSTLDPEDRTVGSVEITVSVYQSN